MRKGGYAMNTTDYAQISSSNIRFLLTKNNMSIRKLAEKIGIAATTLNDSIKSKKGVSVDSLIKIADYFNLTVNDLCNVSLDRKSAQDEEEYDIIYNKFKKLDSHGKELVAMIIDKELERLRKH